jgi:hypothetical protein
LFGVGLSSTSAVGCGPGTSGDDDNGGHNAVEPRGGGGNGGSGGSGAKAGGGGSGTSGGSGNVYVGSIRNSAVDKVDLLLMLDNSSSMANKQQLLAQAIPPLVSRLITPACLDTQGQPNGTNATADGKCSQGKPEFAPVRDLHVGIITSSLGDHGSGDVCSAAQAAANVASNMPAPSYDDLAQLLPSVRPGVNLDNWNNTGFLVWDPRDQTTVTDPHPNLGPSGTNPSTFINALSTQTTAVGEHGCGYEASLEAWYRFLIDPAPVTDMSNDGTLSVRGVTNQVVLEQRAAFLRPDSLLAIVMMSDENDCSILDEDGSEGWLVGYKGGVGELSWHMPRSSSACAKPNDPCCRTCTAPASAGCADNTTDASCALSETLTTNEDAMNLRCFEQVQRFGIDLLYPTERYVEAIQGSTVTPRPGGPTVPNPLYAAGPGGPPRSPAQVILMGLVGVPWQDISTEASWTGSGLEFMTAEELVDNDRWDVILGTPGRILPTDPFMVESIDPRPAVQNPLVHESVLPPTSTTLNAINGHEQAATSSRDDLQFACIFPLVPPVSVTQCAVDPDVCACNADEFDYHSPLCSGVTSSADGSQIFDKAYPGLRELEVLKGVGANAVVTSICPKNVMPVVGSTPTTDVDYGYNPAMAALVAKLAAGLAPSCLPRPLAPSTSDPNRIPCAVIEARPSQGTVCSCSVAGRTVPSSDSARAVTTYMRDEGACDGTGVACSDMCLCEVPQLGGDALAACQAGAPDTGATLGFCYIDPAAGIGSDAAVADCPATSKRNLRFMGIGAPAPGAALFISCGG